MALGLTVWEMDIGMGVFPLCPYPSSKCSENPSKTQNFKDLLGTADLKTNPFLSCGASNLFSTHALGRPEFLFVFQVRNQRQTSKDWPCEL